MRNNLQSLDFPVAAKAGGQTDIFREITLAANQTSSELWSASVPRNTMAIVDVLVRAFAGDVGSDISVTIVHGTDVITGTAHGLVTGNTVMMSASTLPTGASAGTIYYVRKVDANTFTLHTTAAGADGGTAQLDMSDNGDTVVVKEMPLQGVYRLFGVVRNRDNKAALLGSVDQVACEDVAGWDATVAADDTNKKVQIVGTSDTYQTTTFQIVGKMLQASVIA